MNDPTIATTLSQFACARARRALDDVESALMLARSTNAEPWRRLAEDRLEFALLNVEFAELLLP